MISRPLVRSVPTVLLAGSTIQRPTQKEVTDGRRLSKSDERVHFLATRCNDGTARPAHPPSYNLRVIPFHPLSPSSVSREASSAGARISYFGPHPSISNSHPPPDLCQSTDSPASLQQLSMLASPSILPFSMTSWALEVSPMWMTSPPHCGPRGRSFGMKESHPCACTGCLIPLWLLIG